MPDDHRKTLRQQHRRLGLVSHSVIAAFGLAAVAAHTPARAEDAAQPAQIAQEGGSVTLPTVQVEERRPEEEFKRDSATGSKFTEPLLDTPRSVQVIPEAVIKEQGFTQLQDILRTTPGISLGAAEGGNPPGDRMFIRGFEARSDVFIDGIRDVSSGLYRETFNLEQVEINKGPSSAYSGRGGTGGSINLISKLPKAEDFNTATFQVGTDATLRSTLDSNMQLSDSMAFRINVVAHDSEVADRDHLYSKRYGFAPALALGLGTPIRVTLQYYHLDTEGIPDYGHPVQAATGEPIAVDRSVFYGQAKRDYNDTQTDTGTVKIEHDLNEYMKLSNSTRFGININDFVRTVPSAQANGTVNTNAGSRRQEVESFVNQTDLTMDFRTGDVDHTLVTGIEYSRENINYASYTITNAAVNGQNANAPNNYAWNGSISGPGAYTNTLVNDIALYAFDTIKLSPQWELNGGLRLEHFDIQRGRLQSNSDFINVQSGIVYKPQSNGSIYVTYSSSSNPSGEYVDGSNNTYGGLDANNVNTDPEHNDLYEVGTKWDLFNGRLSLTSAVFQINKTNMRITEPGATTLVLEGAQRVRGVEIGAQGSITPEWRIYANYTRLNSDIMDAASTIAGQATIGKDMPFVAKDSFNIFTTYDVTRDFTVGIGATFRDQMYANAANSRWIDDYWRFDAMASYQLTEAVGLRLNIQNLTDQTYYDNIYQSGGYAGIAPGRVAWLTTDVKF
jgi:catecholate siderophore receptor